MVVAHVHREAAFPPVLELRGLTAGYGERTVLADLNLTVRAGEILGMIGPNGAGKSTLIRAVTRVIPARAGTILLGGRPASAMRPAELARYAAVVPQTFSGGEDFTGLQMVLLGRTPHLRLLQSEGPRDVAVALRALALTAATHLADRRVGEMSGGERQRVIFARALAQEPRLLLLDEPTAHLDITHQAAIFALVAARCREDGLAVLAVVHDLTLAAQFCDRLALLTDGRIVAEGTPEAVLRAEVLEAAYGGAVSVFAHPQTGRPVVAPRVASSDPSMNAGAAEASAREVCN